MSTPIYPIRPVLATVAGIALFSAMDAVMKGASIAIGAYSAYLIRCIIGFAMIAPLWWFGTQAMPSRKAMRIHLKRAIVVAFMGLTFFYALVRLPLAEAIAISFVAPLLALYLAAILLGENIRPRAVFAGIAGLAGVLVIIGGRIGSERMTDEALAGIAAVLLSAVLYAWNLVIQREQALLARPAEVSTFQNGIVSLVLLPAAPFLLIIPDRAVLAELTAGAALAVGAALFLAWAYARAEAQVLVPIEYSGFLWAMFFGWLFFAEPVSGSTVLGAVLIILGCLIATRRRPEQSAL